MQISPVSKFNINSVKFSPTFSSRFLVDVGGSVGENSLKTLLIPDNNSDTICKNKDIVNTIGHRSYENQDDFLLKLAEKMAICYKNGLKIYPEDKVVKEVVFFMPGSVYNNKLLYADNIRGKSLKGMNDIDFNKMSEYLKSCDVKISKDFKIKLYQDSMGSGLAVAKKLHDIGMLHAGDYYAVAITGGGCGISNIRAISDNSAIVDASGSSYFTDSQGLLKIANAGASASKFINNFCNAFGIDKMIGSQIASCGIGQIVTMESFKLPQNSQGENLKRILLNLRGIVPQNNNTSTKIKPVYILSNDGSIRVSDDFLDKFNKARFSAISEYADALARFAVIKENEGANGLIITGPLGFAIDKSLKSYYSTSLSELISDRLSSKYNTYELDKIKDSHNFKVYCNTKFSLDDNTEARELALNAKQIGSQRFNWARIDF